MEKPISPCTKECQLRTATCKHTCDKYKEYEKLYFEFDKERTLCKNINSVVNEFSPAQKSIARRRMRDKRRGKK